MEQIEKSLGKKIIRIETNDLDEMEEVRSLFLRTFLLLTHTDAQKMKKALK